MFYLIKKTNFRFSAPVNAVSTLFNSKSTLLHIFKLPSLLQLSRQLYSNFFSAPLRLDIFFRILIPSINFISLTKFKSFQKNSSIFISVIPYELLDLVVLILYSSPLFFNTVFFDISCFFFSQRGELYKIIYYIFKVPLFHTWFSLFVPYAKNCTTEFNFKNKIISLEKLFKSLSWGEREVSEMFNISFHGKVSSRKLLTDYFTKVYPLLKWVPSIGFSELYCSAEGYFLLRGVKVFNSSLS